MKETCALLDCAALRTLGVVVNRVARARSVADNLQARHLEADVLLLIGPSRPADHDRVLAVPGLGCAQVAGGTTALAT